MNANFVIIGLPASGKTTFLAALWHLIEADETECRLKLDSYEGDLKYLNSIAEAWRTFREVPRTSQVGDIDVAIQLVDSVTGSKGRAFFPDLAGETFDVQVEARRCRPIFRKNVDADDGILLFINTNSRQDSLSIVELNSMMPPDDSGDGTADTRPSASTVIEGEKEGDLTASVQAEWEPKKVPAQVRIVQILSDLLRSPFTPRKRQLVVILSAWDVVASSRLSPPEWLAANMPLVDQFLQTNDNSFVTQIYGVSAQGVSLDNSEAVDRAAKLPPSHRISIIGPSKSGHDITEPLAWLISTN
ncbi:hypothetical protein [Bradyrhizobium stylosanthis]|uniref:Double-GTPase 1 domain-containing protein n=1 Tax=Bradyrhizobium stylosanthis TaxID=1803665 RepID=A0A560D674_9BRAD|nr:hypothetical protein [Bradyrhizobium stylosanthis]TWA92612.1 hypothetical protein FBZ96_11082 [Bradyrhizobium stylosanthis]